jgi:hypothetical protein
VVNLPQKVEIRSDFRLWGQKRPDALEPGCLHYPRKQTSVSYAVDCDVIARYGGAKLTDKHLASKIHSVDDEIITWLERRERCNRDGKGQDKFTRVPFPNSPDSQQP